MKINFNSNIPHLLVGCSFTDPIWQEAIPWSVEYAKTHPSYIVAKAGMGIKGICTEAMYYIQKLTVQRVIIILPTLWRMDIEIDEETYIANSMTDLLFADEPQQTIVTRASRKWITSGGMHYNRDTEYSKIFDFMYKHKGFFVIAKEHFRALTILINYCKMHNIEYAISAIQDPMEQMHGLDYIKEEFCQLLKTVEYDSWFKFDNKFIDQYLGHTQHPTTEEHVLLCGCILDKFK